MKIKNLFLVLATALLLFSCVSAKSTLKNIDNNAPDLVLTKDNVFLMTESSTDKKYGYDKDYPINIYYKNTKNDSLNQPRFLNALAGPKGETIQYKKLENCCPFPTKRNEFGVGLLDVYELRWEGQIKPVKIYLNIYEKGLLKVPMGLTLKQF
jgi:hypothetical protein